MADQQLLANMYHTIQSGMVRVGRALHYTELATELGLSPNQAREALHDLVRTGVPGVWLYPNTDYVASFAPFSNIPTQYLVSVEGEQKWYGQ
ncbi:MAG: GntR family transcriptional regulator [Chloroflexota bacterium]|nr:GntR family transcriptional regulator [Chloroflexota bacterium]